MTSSHTYPILDQPDVLWRRPSPTLHHSLRSSPNRRPKTNRDVCSSQSLIAAPGIPSSLRNTAKSQKSGNTTSTRARVDNTGPAWPTTECQTTFCLIRTAMWSATPRNSDPTTLYSHRTKQSEYTAHKMSSMRETRYLDSINLVSATSKIARCTLHLTYSGPVNAWLL